MSSLNDGSGAEELTGQVVPFGKYKDRPVTDVLADEGYREWVLAQPWAREKYPVFYNILIQGGPVPQDSPEHNEMQARFLEDDWCLRLAALINDDLASHGLARTVSQTGAWYRESHPCGGDCGQLICQDLVTEHKICPPEILGREFEKAGWDVFFQYRPSFIRQTWVCRCEVSLDNYWSGIEPHVSDWTSLKRGVANKEPQKPSAPGWLASPGTSAGEYLERTEAAYHERLAEYEAQIRGYPDWKHYQLDHRKHSNNFGSDSWHGTIAAELKPDLGDDYPNVLRQVKGYLTQKFQVGRGQYQDVLTCDAAFLVVRRAQFATVTLDQVRQIFAASGIRLVMESEIAGAAPWTH